MIRPCNHSSGRPWSWCSPHRHSLRRALLHSDVAPVVARAKAQDIERELRAQVERALALGIHPTHLDSHMGALFSGPELLASYIKVAHDYHLPFLAMRPMPLAPSDVALDQVIVAGPEIPREHWKEFYLN